MTTMEINYSDNHWIGFHGKIDTGNHFFYHEAMKIMGRIPVSMLKPILWKKHS